MIKLVISMVPEIARLLWSIYKRYKAGADSKTLQRSMRRVTEIVANPDRAQASRDLNDIWNKPDS